MNFTHEDRIHTLNQVSVYISAENFFVTWYIMDDKGMVVWNGQNPELAPFNLNLPIKFKTFGELKIDDMFSYSDYIMIKLDKYNDIYTGYDVNARAENIGPFLFSDSDIVQVLKEATNVEKEENA